MQKMPIFVILRSKLSVEKKHFFPVQSILSAIYPLKNMARGLGYNCLIKFLLRDFTFKSFVNPFLPKGSLKKYFGKGLCIVSFKIGSESFDGDGTGRQIRRRCSRPLHAPGESVPNPTILFTVIVA
jgi:hypothetical protein